MRHSLPSVLPQRLPASQLPLRPSWTTPRCSSCHILHLPSLSIPPFSLPTLPSACLCLQHYIPTLLASKRLDSESYCHIDGIVAVDWSKGGPHPRTYK